MQHDLADNLNLMGTARHNIRVCHMLKRSDEDPKLRANMPLYVATEPSYYDHTKLNYVNMLARVNGCGEVPFNNARVLPEDSGERFLQNTITDRVITIAFTEYCQTRTCARVQCAKTVST